MRSAPWRWMFGQRELEQPIRALGDIDVALAGLAEDDVRDRLRQLAQLRRDAGPLVRVGDAQLDAARGHLDAALDRGAVVAQHTAHVVAKLVDEPGPPADEVVDIDFEEDVRPALEVEAEHDRPGRNHPARHPGRDRLDEPLPLLRREQARHREQQPDDDEADGRDDLARRKTQHGFQTFAGARAAQMGVASAVVTAAVRLRT
jgi:hypothetical protein